MDAELQQRRSIEAGLRLALQRSELRLVYQPLLGLAQNRVTCVEALLRWDHEGRTVSPVEFIPIAEETGLIVPLGEWVLRKACADAVQWPKHIRVAVNFSPKQFVLGKSVVDDIMAALAESGLEAGRLEVEITESTIIEAKDALIQLREISESGVRISLDDFGTGYSSLSYLRQFPVDKIKIDRSFIEQLMTRHGSSAIVHAVIGLARTLGMETTAEGVEDHAQLEELRRHGCSSVQGFLLGRPVNARAALALLANAKSAVA
jgi:EAL domain-containing protein (putative c-di-GMP-specific phosphodiesterase class I)